ncbi:MAG: VanW family protein [Anaerolineae bacterium]
MKRAWLTVAILIVLAVASYLFVYRDRVYLGVHVTGYDLGGLTRPQAEEFLRAQVAPSLARQTVQMRAGQKLWAPTYTDLGARLDPPATADLAFEEGRQGLLAPLRPFLLLAHATDVDPRVTIDAATFNAYLNRLASGVAVAPKDATVAVAGSTTYAVPAQRGLRLDTPTLVSQLQELFAHGAAGTIDLPLTDALPQVSDSTDAARQAARVIAVPLTLVFGDRTWTLRPADMEPMLTYRIDDGSHLTVDLDKAQLQRWVAKLAADIDRPARDARLKWDSGAKQVAVVEKSQAGQNLDVFATTDRLREAALAATGTSEAPPAERRVQAVVKQTPPRIDASQLDQMGIRELIWEETSFFQGSEPGRVKNITLAASKFDGVVIPPDTVFSFNDIVGEISAATGYDETLIIVDNQTQRGAGGGVCQVSTTLFRAAFWAGLPIVERWAHAYRVSYYEQGNKPLGLEATIFTPNVDLKFKNDTGKPILIQTAVNPANSSLTVRLYGTKPSREVSIDGPTISNRQPPGPPVYEDDPDLPAGQQKQVEWPREGMDIKYSRVIKQAGQVVSRDNFASEYIPTQATFKVGKRA